MQELGGSSAGVGHGSAWGQCQEKVVPQLELQIALLGQTQLVLLNKKAQNPTF